MWKRTDKVKDRKSPEKDEDKEKRNRTRENLVRTIILWQKPDGSMTQMG